jgi:hypothetical protein
MKRGFLDLLDPSNDPEFFWQVISGPPCIFGKNFDFDFFEFSVSSLELIISLSLLKYLILNLMCLCSIRCAPRICFRTYSFHIFGDDVNML